MDEVCSDEAFARYRPWFYAAAIYNLVWGSLNILFPGILLDLLGLDDLNYTPIWQVVGMFWYTRLHTGGRADTRRCTGIS